MRSSLASILLTAWLGAFLLAPEARAQGASPARRTLSESAAKVLRERMGGDPLAALAAWGRAAPKADAPAWLGDDAPRDAAYHELLHAGLWSTDHDAAYAAASLIPESHLDIADIDRWLEVVWPHVFDEDPKWQWDTFKHVVSTQDVARLLHEPQCWFAEIRYFFLSDVHRSLRPEHIPALCDLTHHEDPFVRKEAWGNLANLTTYTDQHRERIARALLAWPGPGSDVIVDQYDRSRNPRFVPRAYTLPVARPGWSPLLRATLERRFLEQAPGTGSSAFAPFLMRWAEDEAPAAEDRLLLRALLDSPHPEGVWIALRALCRVGPDAHLRRVLERMTDRDDEPDPLVLCALGDHDALRALAATDSEAFAIALEFDFEAVWLAWVAEAFGEDAAKGLDALERLADASRELRAPCRPRPGITTSLVRAYELFGGKLDHDRLHRLVVAFPAARTEALLTAYRATITPANLANCAVEVLEVCPYFDFVGDLVEWAKSPDPAQAKPALDLLLRSGDQHLDKELLAHWQQHDGKDLFLLARCATSVVREYLEERLRAVPWTAEARLGAEDFDLLCAAAMVHGLPQVVAEGWSQAMAAAHGPDQERLQARFGAMRERVLEGDPVAALVDSMKDVPPSAFHVRGLGAVDDDRVRDLLRAVRAAPGCNVQWAIGELALLGDFASERELDEMRVRHLYGWFDDASADVRTKGRSLDLVPWLIGEIETICCRRNGAAWALEELTGFDAWGQPEYGMVTQHDAAAAWWQEVGERMRWSVLAGKFVVGPQ